MMHDMLGMDISGVNLREAPRTQALMDQIDHTMAGTPVAFWHDCLYRGEIPLPGEDVENDIYTTKGWPEKVTRDEMWESYLAYLKEQNRKYPGTRPQFGKELRKIARLGNQNKKTEGQRIYIIEPLEQARETFCKRMEIEIEWSQDNEDKEK